MNEDEWIEMEFHFELNDLQYEKTSGEAEFEINGVLYEFDQYDPIPSLIKYALDHGVHRV